MNSTTAAAGAAAGCVLAGFVGFLLQGGAHEHAVLVVNNLVQTLTAVGAGLVCAAVGGRGANRRRAGWLAMAVALVGWGSGQAYWSWSEIVAGREVPFPSPADVGFLVFPVATAVGVALFQRGTSATRSRLRAASDGLIVAVSLFIVSWVTVLDSVYEAGGDSRFAFAVALAYPIGDLLVVALALLLLTRLSRDRLSTALLAGGLLAMGVADSGFAYLSTAGTYHTGSLIDVGWVTAFLLCAVAAVADSGRAPTDGREVISRLGLFLPLLPFSAGVVTLVVASWEGHLDRPLVAAGGALMVLMVARQMVVLAENGDLVATVRRREEQLRHQAFHDPLTGLANRLLFRDRLEHAASLRGREGRELTVLFLDLDGFKLVNDRLGHASGDAVLVEVAERLRGCLRQGDTVGRLGGDEFAVLLEEDRDDRDQVARRISEAMAVLFELGGLRVRGSVGVATVAADGVPDAVADRLLQRADVAMYAAKREANGSYVVYDDGMRMREDGTAGPVPGHRAAAGAAPLGQPSGAPSASSAGPSTR